MGRILLKIRCSFLGRKSLLAPLVLVLAFFVTVNVPAQTNSDVLESVLAQIADLLSVAKYDEAVSLFERIPAPERDSSQMRLLKASVMTSAGKFSEARTIAEAISKSEPRNIEALFVLAAVESAAGRQRQQQTALENIIKIEPHNTEALISLGNISLMTRALRPAASYFHRVLTNEPENMDALLGLSRAFRMNTEWDAAEVLLNRAVELYPGTANVWNERARFHWGRGNMRLALADMENAKKLEPGDYWIALDMGSLLLEMDRKPDSLKEFNRAIAINPREYRAYAYTAGIKDDLGDSEGAERDYAILASLKPDYYFALEGLGLHKMRKGKWAEARDAFAEAYKQAPEEHLYALMTAINWMRAENVTAPRTYLYQVQSKVKRDTLEWYMFRLYYDLTARNYLGESDMILRLDREKDEALKARMLFYMAQYYEIRGNTNLAEKYYLQINELNKKAIPEWRLVDWILTDRKIKPF